MQRRKSSVGSTFYTLSTGKELNLGLDADEDDEAVSLGSLFAPERKEEDPNHVYGYWHLLPDLLLETVFTYLTIRERYYASQVCRSWYDAFNFPRVWYTFTLYDGLLTKRKFNYYAGWEKLVDSVRVSIFLTKRGGFIRSLIFQPMDNLYNLYEFLNLSHYMRNNMPGVLDKVHTLRFRFACQLGQRSEELVFGTGGQTLRMLKKIMGMLPDLKTLELRDLLLEGKEGLQLLDEVCVVCCETLRTLILINITKMAHTLLHPGTFVNLTTLVISPQNIGEDLLELIGTSKLRNMHILQNKYTENGRAVNYKHWRKCRANNPRLRVHLSTEGSSKQELYWQQRAPVKSIVYDSPYSRITTTQMLQVVEYYRGDLEMFAYKKLPRFYMPRSFHDRVDSSLLLLARQCPYLHTLVVRERISTSTVLLLAHTAKNLHLFHVRRNAVILRMDWPPHPDWSPEFYEWLRVNARSYDTVEREVAQILGYRWQLMTDKQFKLIQLDPETPLYVGS
uniref:F-box/LRR-repeat protein 21 n=1 Tax=Hirondellea gigas TaxID=1518452 RepID=A0A6A7FS53_9CRUS